MISKAYEKADFQIFEFSLEDVITASRVIHTTTAPTTTLPATTGSGVNLGQNNGQGGAEFDYSDFFG